MKKTLLKTTLFLLLMMFLAIITTSCSKKESEEQNIVEPIINQEIAEVSNKVEKIGYTKTVVKNDYTDLQREDGLITHVMYGNDENTSIFVIYTFVDAEKAAKSLEKIANEYSELENIVCVQKDNLLLVSSQESIEKYQ